MKRIYRFLFLFVVLSFVTESAWTQTAGYKELHEVKRKETIFGIARENGLTVEELVRANPEMNSPYYELKKGTYIRIPYPSNATPAPAPVMKQNASTFTNRDMRNRAIRVGVVLPLHNDNGDGRRMAEYYRGVLMACDSLKASGISTDIRAWDLRDTDDISKVLQDPQAAACDLLIGPLYTKFVKPLGDFAARHNINLLIPFSTTSQEVYNNGNIYQAFQNGNALNHAYVFRYYERFKNCHTVIIDCNDTTSTKGGFTSTLRQKLEQEGKLYSITNLRSPEDLFASCFSTTRTNVVVLNTSRSNELTVAFAKLNGLLANNPELRITLFGYTEWLMYSRHLDNFYKFDTYVPSTYFMNFLSPRTERIKLKYRQNFRQDMQPYHQRYAVTGFDQAYFMIKGMHLYGSRFTGAPGMVGYTPFQTPLRFERVGNGGLQNRAILFVHYTTDNQIETINF